MNINLDDVKYVSDVFITRSTDSRRFGNIESVMDDENVSWVFFMFSTYVIQFVYIDAIYLFDPIDAYYLNNCFYESNGCPEMEEKIRRNSKYRVWYTKDTGYHI